MSLACDVVRILRALAFLLYVPAGPSRAAEIHVHPDASNGIAVIVLQGEILVDDGARFARASAPYPHAIVFFDSLGGNVAAGLMIGRIMQLRHYASAVIAGDVCASACALAWLSGQPRVMDEGARIGFHAAFIRQGTKRSRRASATP